jgi:hypothetical protein
MPTWDHRSVIGLLSALVLAAGCSASSASLAPAPSKTPSSVSLSTPTLAPTVTPDPSPAAIGTARPAASRTPGTALVGKTAVTAVDGVRVRSQPRVSDDSFKEEPLLPRGTALYVLDGPVTASGYDWYNVAQLSSRTLPSGWVASASRDGEAWIVGRAFDCPPMPDDFSSLATLPEGVGLACFPRVPITVQARLISCNCDVDGSWYEPSWFFLGSGGPNLLVEPGVTSASSQSPGDWFALNLDPTGQHPDVLPIGDAVEVTGIFDHPAAANCTRTEMDGQPVPSQGCRLEFAVTRLVAVRP